MSSCASGLVCTRTLSEPMVVTTGSPRSLALVAFTTLVKSSTVLPVTLTFAWYSTPPLNSIPSARPRVKSPMSETAIRAREIVNQSLR